MDSGDRGSDELLSLLQVITVESLSECTSTSGLPQKALLSSALAWFAVEPCPNLSCTTHYERQENMPQS